ncbi:HesB/YadR/YfhF family protein [Bacillus sp. AK031]
MKFSVSNEAAQWFIYECDLSPGDHVEIFTKIYGGIPTVYPDYFLGMSVGKTDEGASLKTEVENITFYISNGDEWLLDEYNLNIKISNGEVDYIFIKSED